MGNQGGNIQLWDPRVFLILIPFPFYQELELASHKLAVPNSFYCIVFFSIHHFWWQWWMSLLTWNGVFWSLEKLDHVEDWMKPRHGGWESEAVCIPADLSCHCKGSKVAVGEFLQRMCDADVTHI